MLERLPKPVNALIGNWNEEAQLRDAKLKEFLDNYSMGSLAFTKFNARVNICTRKASLGGLKSKSNVMLLNANTKGFLSASVSENFPTLSEGDRISLSTSSIESVNKPTVRSTFQLEAFMEEKIEGFGLPQDDGVLRFGQKYFISINSELHETNLFLSSIVKSPTQFSRIAKKKSQLAFLTSSKDYNAVWTLQYAEPNFRLEMEGEEIKPGMKFIATHCATGKHLSSDKGDIVRNDFAAESEVCCENVIDQNTGFERAENIWQFGSAV